MQPEEIEPERLTGWFVVEVGCRQAWPYVGLADPDTGREVRLYVDTTFSVEPKWVRLNQQDDAVLRALDDLLNLTVQSAGAHELGLRLDLGHVQLHIEAERNDLTVGESWWIGTRPA